MANTVNFSKDNSNLNGQGSSWTAILNGTISNPSRVEIRSGTVEWIEAATASNPSVNLRGHVLGEGEIMDKDTLASGRTIFSRYLGTAGAIIVVTPG